MSPNDVARGRVIERARVLDVMRRAHGRAHMRARAAFGDGDAIIAGEASAVAFAIYGLITEIEASPEVDSAVR